MTSKEYIKKLDFEYFEIYSLLREHESKEYAEKVHKLAEKTPDKIKRQELLGLIKRGSKRRLIETGKPHPTAMLTNIFEKEDSKALELKEILSIDFSTGCECPCTPIFREMIVFYDNSNEVISLLHICFSCDRIEDENFKEVKTDLKIFDKLREYFKSIGHKIE